MTQEDGNRGVIIHGSSTGPVAAGENATANQINQTDDASLPTILKELRRTRRLIEENRSQLNEPELALEEVDDIADLIRQDQPDRKRIIAKVDRLVNRLSAIGGIAGGTWGLSQLITQLLL